MQIHGPEQQVCLFHIDTILVYLKSCAPEISYKILSMVFEMCTA